ncbi:lichenan operon transcriptional antiterminator [Enterococcus sp. AZ194]|uniref:BglG family transcription antiterminator n=1 Tax=Enterococcus sp. AZ194 TaxID=2774629 RepID=UPI003F2138E6
MREKYVKLIVSLQEKRGFVKGSELAQKLRVSDRTIRSYIRDLNENYLIDAKIKNNKNKGYILTGEIKEIRRSQQIEFEERAFFIIKYLMEKNDWVTYEEIAEDLLFSSQTIRNDVLKIQQLMDDQLRDIKVESIIFQGIKLVGSEIDKRLFLDSLSNPPALTNSNFIKSLSHYFKNWTTVKELNDYVSYIEQNVDQLKIPSNDENLLPIISYLVICLKRIEALHSIDDASHLLDKYDITQTKEYSISKKLLHGIAKQRSINIPEAEIIYLSFYLMSQRLLFEATKDNEPHIPEEIKRNITEALVQLEKEYHMDFSNDSQLSSGLILHLSRDIYPLLFNFYIENSFVTTIKQEYIQAYYISVSFAHLISQKLEINIPENEIGYLALHFASFIERKNKNVIQAMIVSGRNKPASVLLKRELEQKVAGLQISNIITFEEISFLSSETQLLISPIELNEVTTIPTIQVCELATEKDIHNLKELVNKLLSKKLLKVNYFNRTSLNKKESVLKYMLQEMNIEHLYESLIERERLSTTEVGNGVAIPHPLSPSNQSQMRIGILILEKPVFWGSDEVNLVFLVIPGKDKQAEMSQLMEEIHRIVINKEYLKLLANIKTKEELDTFLES